jgi:hypothetical protein
VIGLMLGAPLWAEDANQPIDTVGRVDISYGYGALSTLDQTSNAALISSPSYFIRPALDVGLYGRWMFTMESTLRMMKWDAPLLAAVVQDPGLTASATAGWHFRADPLEAGFLVGLGESAFVSSPPSTSRVTVQNLAMPHIGFRFGMNGRYKNFFTRIEVSYMIDVVNSSDRSSLTVQKSDRWLFNGQFGYGKTKEWLRLTAGVGLQNAETNLGRQTGAYISLGVSIGRIWGQRPPLER